MADYKSNLRELFTPHNERLLAAIQITKGGSGKKKKLSYICVSVTLTKPASAMISKIKKQDERKGDQYKKQKVYDLKELRQVNGKSTTGATTEFDLVLEKTIIRAAALTVTEKHTFLGQLHKICNRYLGPTPQPEFLNIPTNYLEVAYSNMEHIRNSTSQGGQDEDKGGDYHAITEQEECDLDRMMKECDFAISDAEKFVSSLSKDLNVLDGQNIHSIMGSESQVNSLMLLLDKALGEVQSIETQLDEYDLMMGGIASQMGQMKNQESFIQITNTNHVRLLDELDTVVMQLDLSKGHIKALREGDLSTDSGIEACTSAAEALQQAMEVELPHGLSRLQAVVEQQKLFAELRQRFAKRLFDFLGQVFLKQGNENVTPTINTPGDLKLPKHFNYHRNLLPYRHLLLWLKKADKTKHTELSTCYTKSLNRLYTNEIKDFMTNVKTSFMEQAITDMETYGSSSMMQQDKSSKKLLSTSKLFSGSRLSLNKRFSSSIKNLSGSQTSLKEKKNKFGSTQSLAFKGMGKKLKAGFRSSKSNLRASDSRDSLSSRISEYEVTSMGKKLKAGFKNKNNLRGSRESLASRISENEVPSYKRFSTTFREVLAELEPVCQEEEVFLVKFFNLNVDSVDTMMPGGSDDELDDSPKGVEERKKYQEAQVTKEIRPNNHLWLMMTEIFTVVENELSQLIIFGKELDQYNTLNMLVVIGQRVDYARQQSDGSFLAKVLGSSLVKVKTNFDDFSAKKIKDIDDWNLPKGKKCGVLPFVIDFENFLELSENIFRDSSRRSNIDKAYKLLMQSVIRAIGRNASESQKTPAEVVEFQNYHHLNACLASFKIAALDQERKEVKNLYNDAVHRYVNSMMGRPMEKLSNFFEGVKMIMEGGVRAEEVGYQLKFSKQELRRCIKEYSGKDIKKGLESLYHKIEKHTAENDNRLQQVVWQFMQEEFISQYKHYEDLITRCYPDSSIRLEFTIKDVLDYFTNIAMSQKA